MRTFFVLFLLVLPKFAFGQAPSCQSLFHPSRPVAASTQLSQTDELLLHIQFIQQISPLSAQHLADIGISPQILGFVQQMFETLERIRTIRTDMQELSQLIFVESNDSDVASAQTWLNELQNQARELRRSYRLQRQQVLNFIRSHNIYPQYDGIYLDIDLTDGPKGSDVFVHFLQQLYGSYSFDQGWSAKVISQTTSHIRLLIRSPQALAHLAGEMGIHSWNTVQAELGDGSGLYKPDAGGSEKRRMIRARVSIQPYIRFRYKMNMSDVRIEQFNSASGNGGQKRNKTSSDVRVTHTPSGISAEGTEHRTLQDNKRAALERLETNVQNYYRDRHDEALRESFARIERIDINRTARAIHLRENRITGLESSRVSTRGASTLSEISQEELFLAIRNNANVHFDTAENQTLENITSQILAIEREAIEEVGEQSSGILEELESLVRAANP